MSDYEEEQPATPRPTYSEALLACLKEGYSAYQERRKASAELVRQRLGFSREEVFEFEKHLAERELIDLGAHDERRAALYQLLPIGRLLMEQWPAIERTFSRVADAIDKAPSTSPEKKGQVMRWLWDYIARKALDKGGDYVIENHRDLWLLLRAQLPGLPDLPDLSRDRRRLRPEVHRLTTSVTKGARAWAASTNLGTRTGPGP